MRRWARCGAVRWLVGTSGSVLVDPQAACLSLPFCVCCNVLALLPAPLHSTACPFSAFPRSGCGAKPGVAATRGSRCGGQGSGSRRRRKCCHCAPLPCVAFCNTTHQPHLPRPPQAKTIDLCNNPMTKEPKLQSARRIIAEWPDLNREAEEFTTTVEQVQVRCVHRRDVACKQCNTNVATTH